MSSGDGPKEDERKGFGGLAGMVSDVDTAVSKPPLSAQATSPSQPGAHAAPSSDCQDTAPAAPGPRPYQPVKPQASSSSGWKWAVGIVAVVAFSWVLAQSTGKNSNANRGATGSTQPGREAPPQPAALDEKKPPPGTDMILSSSQIRYCLAEDIRVGAARSVVNTSLDSEVDRFNAMVTDYNIRCGQFRYREGALESARSEVEAHRAEIEAEGRSRLVGGFGSAALNPSAAGNRAGSDWDAFLAGFSKDSARQTPEPDATVRSIQQALNALGYDAGPADGLLGGRTRDAVVAFQKDQGIAADGIADASLLQHLSRVRSGGQPVADGRMPSTAGSGPAARSSPDPERRPDLSRVSPAERRMIEDACEGPRRVSGPGAYHGCLARQLSELSEHSGTPDLSRASPVERRMIEDACEGPRRVSGPGAYYSCLARQLSELSEHSGKPDLSRATAVERKMIEDACEGPRRVSGPGAYYSCLARQLSELSEHSGKPDLSRASPVERRMIEDACEGPRRVSGPGAYYSCLARQLSELSQHSGKPDLSRATAVERKMIEDACEGPRRVSGPGAYYSCLAREFAEAGYR